jgi:hypothetical protein
VGAWSPYLFYYVQGYVFICSGFRVLYGAVLHLG